MKCPKCKDVELKVSKNCMAGKENGKPQGCPKCGGMWLTSEEVTDLSNTCTSFEEGDITPNTEADMRTGLCPVGHGLLIRAKIHEEPHFYLERCSICGGIWFDRGEWNRLAEHHLMDNLGDFWTHAWQKKQRKLKTEEQYKESLKNKLGDKLFKSLWVLSEALKEHPHKAEAMAFLLNETEEN